MSSVSINPPKTPVTKGSKGVAAATTPNVCKMPGPPAPFVPAPLPNIGKSGDSPKDYSKRVLIEGHAVAIKGASFGSMGDAASKATGGGLLSMNTHGPTKFVGPGSFDVLIEGKNVQLLGDQMLNNCGPSGSPPNAATLAGLLQVAAVAASFQANPDNVDYCGAGNHSEEIHHPKVPPGEEDPAARLATLRAQAGNDGDTFEATAAEYNLKKGHLTHGSQISRRLTEAEERAGLHSDDQKIWIICSVCKHRREADEAPSKDSTVEAKSTEGALETSKQKKNNAALVASGKVVTYKCPHIKYEKFKSWTEEGFVMRSIPGK